MTRPLRALALAGLLVAAVSVGGRAAAPVYYPDDPLAADPDTRDAAAVRERDISDPYDFLENTFFKPGDHANQRAVNVNTIDEVPDSSWFTNRIDVSPLSAADIGRGPNVSGPPAPGPWTVVSGKSDGITPGFTVRDQAGVVWFIKFDPVSNPEMATGAEMIATKLFWALGYHVPENYLAILDADNLVVTSQATIRDTLGHRRALTRADVTDLLVKGARRPDGRYRVIASRSLPGTPVGPSSPTARGPTTPTTSSRTSTGASCAGCAPSRRGSTTTTRARSTRSTRWWPRPDAPWCAIT